MRDTKKLSEHYKHWISCEDNRRCVKCEEMHGKVYELSERVFPHPPLHPFCRCIIKKMETIRAGTASIDGVRGADWYLKNKGILPDYYITKDKAKQIGWKDKLGNLSVVAPGRMIGGIVYRNNNNHLPSADNRIWYEADINYRSGHRTPERVLYSNDGLIFVTYDHYQTFIEII